MLSETILRDGASRRRYSPQRFLQDSMCRVSMGCSLVSRMSTAIVSVLVCSSTPMKL